MNGKRPAFDSAEQEAYLNLWRTYDRLSLVEDQTFEQIGITPQQYNLLRLLRSRAGQAVPTLELASQLVSRAPDITRMIDKLESAKLVARNKLETNRRVVQVSITPEGLALLERVKDQIINCHQKQLGHMSESDLAELVRLLKLARSPFENNAGRWK